jgi:hypothetical protein
MADSDTDLCQHGDPRGACAERCTCGHPCATHPIDQAGACAATKCGCQRFTDRPRLVSKVAQPAHD